MIKQQRTDRKLRRDRLLAMLLVIAMIFSSGHIPFAHALEEETQSQGETAQEAVEEGGGEETLAENVASGSQETEIEPTPQVDITAVPTDDGSTEESSPAVQSLNEEEAEITASAVLSGDGNLDLSGYSQPLIIYNALAYTWETGESVANTSAAYSLQGTSAVSVEIGDRDGATGDQAPLGADIHISLNGLTMPEETILTVHPVNTGANAVNMTVQAASVLHTLRIDSGATLHITLNTDLTVTALTLGDGSTLHVNTNGHAFTVQSVAGNGTFQVSGTGTVNCPWVSVGNLQLSEATVNAAGGSITATQSITVNGASVQNAALFGYGAGVTGEKNLVLNGGSFSNVSMVGAGTDCTAPVRLAGVNTITSSTNTKYVYDYTLAYTVNGTPVIQNTWPVYYRVQHQDLAGSSATILGSINQAGTYTEGSVTLPDHTISGYGYAGWQVDGAGDAIYALSNQHQDLTLSLVLVAGSVTATLDLGYDPDETTNDAPIPTRTTISSGKLGDTITLPTPVRFGYLFEGWKVTSGDATGLYRDTYTIAVSDLTAAEEENAYLLTLEAQWTADSFPLYLVINNTVPLTNVQISADGSTWYTPEQFAAAYTGVSWDGAAQTFTISGMKYAETLGAFFGRVFGEGGYPILQDTRDASVRMRFLSWSTLSGTNLSGVNVYEAGDDLLGEQGDKTLAEWQEELKEKPVNLTSAWTTMDYTLTTHEVEDWTVVVNGIERTPDEEGKITITAGAKVAFRVPVTSTTYISRWSFAELHPNNAETEIFFAPTERSYTEGGTYLYYDFLMPNADVSASFEEEIWVDLAKSPITLAEGVSYNNHTMDGFWYEEAMTQMTYLFQNETGGYFYPWSSDDALYVTTHNVETTNQLTLINTITVHLKECNLALREEYLEDAVGRTLGGKSAEAKIVNADTAKYGNIVIDTRAHVSYTVNLNICGENTLGTIFHSQMLDDSAYLCRLNITGMEDGVLHLGGVWGSNYLDVQYLNIQALTTNSEYLCWGYGSSGRFNFVSCTLQADKQRLYNGNKDILMRDVKAWIGSIYSRDPYSIAGKSTVHVLGDIESYYYPLEIGANGTVIVDGDLRILASHNTGAGRRVSGLLIVKGNRCDAGNLTMNRGTIVANVVTLGNSCNITGGTIVANQIMNSPVLQGSYYTTAARANGDDDPFLTYAQSHNSSTSYQFAGGDFYLLGRHWSAEGTAVDADNPVAAVIDGLLDENGDLKEGAALDSEELLRTVQDASETNAGNECFVLGNSAWRRDQVRNRSMHFTGINVYAAGNITLYNDTTVTGGTISCAGVLSSKHDLLIRDNANVTAAGVGNAYNLTTVENALTRYGKVSIIGCTVTTDALGAVARTIGGVEPCSVVEIGENAVLQPRTGDTIAVKTMLYANYIGDEAVYEIPEVPGENPGVLTFTGTIPAGTTSLASYLTMEEEVSLVKPTMVADTKEASWNYESPGGTDTTYISLEGCVNGSKEPDGYVYDGRTQLALYAAKGAYGLTVAGTYDGGFTVTAGNTALTKNGILPVKPEETVTITLDNKEAFAHTVVWYEDVAGVPINVLSLEGAVLDEEDRTITFPMPALDTQVFITEELTLDLSDYPIAFTKEGFRVEWEVTRTTSDFAYGGDLLIQQSDITQMAVTNWVGKSQTPVTANGSTTACVTQNYFRFESNADTLTRTITLERILQQGEEGNVGNQVAEGVDARLIIRGIVQLVHVQVPETASIEIKGETDRNTDVLFIYQIANKDTSWIGNRTGKAGDITLQKLRILATAYGTLAYSGSTGGGTFIMKDCRMVNQNFHYRFRLAYNMSTVQILGCELEFEMSSSYGGYPFLNCGMVEFKNSRIDYTEGSKEKNCSGGFFAGMSSIVVEASAIMLHEKNSDAAMYYTRKLYSSLTPSVILKSGAQLTSDYRLTLRGITVEEGASLTVGDSTNPGYLFCSDVQVEGGSVEADHIILSGFYTGEGIDKSAVLAALTAGTDMVTVGILTMTGGSVTADTFLGGQGDTTITVEGGNLTAGSVGTSDKRYGYGQYIPKVGEEYVYSLAKTPTKGAVVNISGGTVSVSEHLGGQLSQVTISGGEVTGEAISTPYGTATISGADAAVSVANLTAENGVVTIENTKEQYENPYTGTDKNHARVGVLVSDTLEARNLSVKDGAVVYANEAYVQVTAGNSGVLEVTGDGGESAHLYTGEDYGSQGEGSAEILVAEDGSRLYGTRQYAIHYVLGGNEEDPAVNAVENPSHYTAGGEDIILSNPSRSGYDFAGWYENSSYTGESLTKLTTAAAADITIYAKWVPKLVTFSVSVDTSLVPNLTEEVAGIPGSWNEDHTVFTFERQVQVAYLDQLYGTEEGHIDLSDYYLDSYGITELSVDETDYAGDIVLPVNGTVTKELLNTFLAKEEENPVVSLKATLIAKARVRLTLDLNLDKKNRPLDSSFLTVTEPETRTTTTISSFAEISSTIVTAPGFADTEGNLVKAEAPGYTFVGWYTNSECTGEPVTKDYVLERSSATYLYAKWMPNVYRITFEAGAEGIITSNDSQPEEHIGVQTLSGEGTYDTVLHGNLTYESQAEQGLPYAWKQGHVFAGWTYEAAATYDATGSYDITEDTPILSVTDELNLSTVPAEFFDVDAAEDTVALTLYALYRPVEITYVTNGGQWKNGYTGETITVNATAYGAPLAGYTLEGDACSIISTTAEAYATNGAYDINDYRHAVVRKGYTFLGWFDREQEVQKVPAYEDVTVTAKWQANTYTLELYALDESKEADYYDTDFVYGYTNQVPTATVVVGEEIGSGINGVEISSWPSRGDANPWYAYNQGDAQSAKRYLLGFTFDSLNPGHTEDGHAGYEAYVKYQGYVNLLTNRDSLFVREEEGSAGTTAGSIFRLPEDAEYGDLSNTQVVPDYPDGSTIPMYGTYREYSLVFVEYLIDVDGNIQETVLASYPYSSWQDYPYSENEGYGATGHEAAWNAKGYSLTGWRVNGRGTSYAEYAATEADYNEVFADYQAEAQALGTYDILVYTAYAPQVSVENVSLMTRTDPTTDQQSSYTYTLPGSLQEGSLTYTISDLTGLTLVEGENWNKYDHGTNAGGERIADTTVAVKAVLSSAAGVVKGSTWLTQSDGSTTDLFGEEVTAEAGDRITLTLYHSSIISRTENIFFDLKLGYEEEVLSEQYITFEDLQIGMRPSIYEVTYQVEVPVEQELVVSDWKEFHETNHTRILGVNYGSPVLAGIPDIEGYTANGQWKYSDTELDYGEGLFLPVTAADNGRITLESEWNINDYVLWGANELLEHWEIAYDGTVLTGGSILGSGAKVTIPYHTTVTFTPKTGEDYPEFVWLTLKETVEDALEETTLWLDHYKEAEEQEGVYTFRMPAADVDAAYQNVMDLYLEKGSITINETGYLQETAGQEGENQSEPVTWRGDYVILMDAENNTDNSSTDNTLRLTGDLSGRGIALGNLFITGEDSIALEADTNAELVTLYEAAGSAIEAKNILVPETAALIMRGSGTLNLAPENGAAAIGGRNGEQSKNGTITLEALEIHMNLRPSRASGIGAGDQTKGGGAVLLTDCTVTVTETPTASDVYHGAWIGGYQVTSVTLQNTTVNRTEASIEMIGPKVLDGQTVSLNESSIGTQALPVTDPIHAETRLVITDSNIYQKLQMDDSIALCVEDGGTAGVIEVTNSTIESIVRDPKALYTGTLKLLDVNSDVVLANTQMLEATHGDITIDAEQVKQGVTTHAHSGSYLLLHELEGSAAPAVTVNTVTDIQRLTIQDAGIGALHVNGDVTLQPEGEAESGLVTIKSGVLLSVEAGEEDTLRLNEGFDTTTSGSFRQTGGILEGGTDLAVGGNLTLSEVTVTAEIGSIGSHGVGGVTKVILNGGSVTAQTVGALGAQHETFTFVELLNEPETEGTLVQDLYRLTYVLENEDYPKNSEGVPYDAAYADTEISLPTVLRSTTLTDGTESVSPLIPGEPKYTGGGSTYFGNWYLSDPEENLYVLSTQEVPGFENRLAGLRAEQIEWTEEAEEDGTRTLTLYAWMQVQGSGVIEEGRQLNEVTGSATTVTKTADGAWTARFTVESPALPNSSYAFEVTEPFPAGTKLTLGLMHEEVPKFYWYLCTGEETAIPMEAFVRMGAAAGNSPSLEQGEPGSIWTHELQLSADVSEAEHVELTDTEVFVKLQFLQEGSAVDVAEVSYTIEAAPVASLTAEEEGVTVSFGGDSRLSGKTLYLTGEFLPTDEKNRIPYDATVELGEAVGRRISESTWAFELQDAEEAMGAVQYKQELFGFTAGTYEVTWKLTAAYPDNVNVLGHILTEDTVLVTVAESPEPEMEVSLQSIDGQETTSRTLGAGSTHRAKFAIETNQSNVTVTAEKQTALASFAATEKVTGIMEGSTATVTFPADLEGGVYRIRFSFAEGSEQDDVYYTFIVENVQ